MYVFRIPSVVAVVASLALLGCGDRATAPSSDELGPQLLVHNTVPVCRGDGLNGAYDGEIIIIQPACIVVIIDIKPGSDPNSINTKSKGTIAVAILGSDNFDVNAVDVATLVFGPDRTAPAHKAGGHIQDVTGDGLTDLVSHYRTQETGLAVGAIDTCLSGLLLNGTPIEGCDAVRIVR